MKIVATIRKHGLKKRMPEPMSFLSHINKLCIAMSKTGRKAGGNKERKAILRLMKKIFNGICSRNPKELSERLEKEERFATMLRRRSQTEARIGILKNVFLQGTPRAKGFENRKLQVDWTVLSHNLWLIARRGPWKEGDEIAALAA